LLRGQKCVVLAGELFDQLLIPVQLLKIVRRHGIDPQMLRAVKVILVSDNTQIHSRSWESRQANCSRAVIVISLYEEFLGKGVLSQALVFLRVIVLQRDLQFDGFEESALVVFAVGVGENLLHIGTNTGDTDFRHG
jgi:hypothetical protein